MSSKFDEIWLSGTSTYLDDVLWAAVVHQSDANEEHTAEQAKAAWEAYCKASTSEEAASLIKFIEAGGEADIDGTKLYDLILGHRGLDGIVRAVNEAIAAIEDDDEDDEHNERCAVCGATKHTLMERARCATHLAEWHARGIWRADVGLLGGHTRDEYMAARAEVVRAAQQWLELAATATQREQATGVLTTWR